MIKPCKYKPCSKNFPGRPNKLFCSPKCKKLHEISLRNKPKTKKKRGHSAPLADEIKKPPLLDGYASVFWDKTAPILIKRGHLNILSEDAFAELCDLVARLRGINTAINESGRSLLQGGEKAPEKSSDKTDDQPGATSQSSPGPIEAIVLKESALSDLKRKYSNLLLVYCKQFYLTPAANRGDFNIPEGKEKDPLDEFLREKNGK
jgi:phage terminase small subunit